MGKQKSRYGCPRCKAQRVKCDEGIPSCSRCTRLGVVCRPHQHRLKWTPDRGSLTLADGQALAGSVSRKESRMEENRISSRLLLPCDDWQMAPHRFDHRQSQEVTEVVSLELQTEGHTSNPYRRSIPACLPDTPVRLLQYYLEHTCSVISVYDGALNPFRKSILDLWHTSPSIHYTVQSLAAACISDKSRKMEVVGIKAQQEAFGYLARSLQSIEMETVANKDELLLAIILLGYTSAWHSTCDLGVAHYKAALEIVKFKSQKMGILPTEKSQNRQLQFFQESMLYWWMLLVFVADQSISDLEAPPHAAVFVQETQSSSLPGRLPHPWTCVAPEIKLLFGKIGSLVRYQRQRNRHTTSLTYANVEKDITDIETARSLEAQLCSLQLPSHGFIVDPGDPETRIEDFVAVDDAYRGAGLLLLYRSFPDLLCSRLISEENSNQMIGHLHTYSDITIGSYKNTQILYDLAYQRLISLALFVLSMITTLRSKSKVHSVVPLILLVVSNELRFQTLIDSSVPVPSNQTIEKARDEIRSRMEMFSRIFPSKPVLRLTQIMDETWRRLDAGDRTAFWMDVMIEKGWETVLG